MTSMNGRYMIPIVILFFGVLLAIAGASRFFTSPYNGILVLTGIIVAFISAVYIKRIAFGGIYQRQRMENERRGRKHGHKS